MIHYINKRKDKNHMIISIDAEKYIKQNSTSIHDKTFTKVGTEGTFLNIIKVIYNKSTANIILGAEKMKTFPLNSGTRQGCSLSPLFSIEFES